LSLTRFHRETNEALRASETSTEKAQELVRDRWLSAKEYRAIVAAILGNWTSGNGVPFMAPVSKALLAANEIGLHHHLWAKSIKRQSNTFFREYSFLRGQKLTSHEILSIDSSGFDEFNWNSYTDKRVAAFLLTRLLSDLNYWRTELVCNGLSSEGVDHIADSLRSLKKPDIELGQLTPNYAIKGTSA
jgi:hypothetical protein